MKGNAKDDVSTAQQFFTAYDAHDVDGMLGLCADGALGRYAPFLHAERASPKRHAVDLPRRWAWIVVPVSQVIRSASFAVSRFRRHQLKASVALVILSCIRV